jgi:hypothetical protein
MFILPQFFETLFVVTILLACFGEFPY